jgi:hypothetical protein
MMDFLLRVADLLGASRYSQHAICLTNDPVMIFLFVTGDTITAASYFTIGLSLIYYRTRVVQFSVIARGLYGAFIFLCGASHATEVLTMFTGIYRLDVAVTAAMGVVSAFTAVVTWNEISRGTAFAET